MKKLIAKILLISFVLACAATVQAVVTNDFFAAPTISALPYQPQSDDLAQGSDATNYYIYGGMHGSWADNDFKYIFNSPVDGQFGVGSPDSVDGESVMLYDQDQSLSTTTMIMKCDFNTPKVIVAIQVFSKAPYRMFNYCEVYYSITGTDPYNYIGAVSFGNWGDAAADYANSNCVAKLYDNSAAALASNVKSVKIVVIGVIDDDWGNGNYQWKMQNKGGGENFAEIDIIGVPEPFYLSFIICNLLIFNFVTKRRNNIIFY